MARVHIVEPKITDIGLWYGWFNDQDVTDAMNKGIFINTVEAQEVHFKRVMSSREDIQFMVDVETDDGRHRIVGTIGIHKIDWVHRRGDVSVVVGDKDFRGKGVATEAIRLIVRHGFIKMNLRKLTAGMWASNTGSIRAFEKNGFALEGTLRENFHHRGIYVAEFRYGLLRPDWEKAQT